MLVQDAVSRRMCPPPLLTVPANTPPPIFLISTLTLQSPGLIKSGKWVIGEEGLTCCRVRQAVLCKRLGLDTAGRELTQHAFLAGPGGGTKVNTGHREKECES